MDNLLLAAAQQDQCWRGTLALLGWLEQAGYKVSWKKAQVCQQQVHYLGFNITAGRRTLEINRHQAICRIERPTTKCSWGQLGLAAPGYQVSHKLLSQSMRLLLGLGKHHFSGA